MKKLRLIRTLLFGGGLLLTGCGGGEELLQCGGFQDSTVSNAPKTITSTEILSFSCDFAMINVWLQGRDSQLLGNSYTLAAEWKDGVVKGRYVRRPRFQDGSSHSFQAGREFLDELQELVTKHDLAHYNGISRYVFGLPEGYGAGLSVKYASGESIQAHDNRGCFLPLDAMEDLELLFRQQAEQEETPADP